MNDSKRIGDFFQKLSIAADEASSPSLSILHGEKTNLTNHSGTLQDYLVWRASVGRSRAMPPGTNDFGVGPPPLANV